MNVTDDESVAAGPLGGRLDVLVNNAGIISVAQPRSSTPPGSTWRCWSTSVGPCASAARRTRFCAAGAACIVNLASVGSTFGLPQRLGYSTSKTGVVGLTRTLAVEWGPRGFG